MIDRAGIFTGEKPFDILRRWLEEASQTEPSDPNAMSLATVDSAGLPDVRIVLLKEIEDEALVFYTNFDSAKGRQLDGAGKAAIGIHWKSLGRQIRARGRVERVSGAQADAYYASRPLESRIGAWASKQSHPIPARATLELALERMSSHHGDSPTRPPNWGGYRLIPSEMEFWADGAFRLHDRFLWKRSRNDSEWCITRLSP